MKTLALLVVACILVAGCATNRNVGSDYTPAVEKNTGLAVGSVTYGGTYSAYGVGYRSLTVPPRDGLPPVAP